jgi:hypothetical protein
MKKKKISIYEFRGIDLDGRSRFWGRGKTKAIAKEQCELAAKEYLIRQGISLAYIKDYTFKDIGLSGFNFASCSKTAWKVTSKE